jgi:hypothetical protein
MERYDQAQNYAGRVVGTTLTHSDYAGMARALGAHRERVERSSVRAHQFRASAVEGGPDAPWCNWLTSATSLPGRIRTVDKCNEELPPNNGVQGTHNSGAALGVARPRCRVLAANNPSVRFATIEE